MAQGKGIKGGKTVRDRSGESRSDDPRNRAPSPATVNDTLRSAVSSALPAGFTVKRQITLPTLVLKRPGDKRVIRILDEMRVSKIDQKAGTDADGKTVKKEPATICTVVDAQTGETFTYLVAAVVKSNLERDYPAHAYVGKTFLIENLGKRSESQRYNDFRIFEVEGAATAA